MWRRSVTTRKERAKEEGARSEATHVGSFYSGLPQTQCGMLSESDTKLMYKWSNII
jgi:hypothetical protein